MGPETLSDQPSSPIQERLAVFVSKNAEGARDGEVQLKAFEEVRPDLETQLDQLWTDYQQQGGKLPVGTFFDRVSDYAEARALLEINHDFGEPDSELETEANRGLDPLKDEYQSDRAPGDGYDLPAAPHTTSTMPETTREILDGELAEHIKVGVSLGEMEFVTAYRGAIRRHPTLMLERELPKT